MGAISYSAAPLPTGFSFNPTLRKVSYSGSFVSGLTDVDYTCSIAGVASNTERSILAVLVANSAPTFDSTETT